MAKITMIIRSGMYRMQSECGATGGPGGGFDFENTCWQLTTRQKERLAELTRQREEREAEQRRIEEKERQDLEATARRKDAAFRRTRLFRDIAETIGTDDLDTVKDFRGLMQDIHEARAGAAIEYNETFDELVDQFVGEDIRGRRNRGAFVSQLQRVTDPTKVPRFDEVVQFVRDNPRMGQILADNLGESVGTEDVEALVFEGLRQGKQRVPTLNSEEIWESALEFLDRTDIGEEEEEEELDFAQVTPFALRMESKP